MRALTVTQCMLSTSPVLPSLACTAQQIQWELAPDSNVFSDGTSDGMLIHLPPSSSSGGAGGPDAPPPSPPLLLSMLTQPPGAGCPLCPPPQEPAQQRYWPPETPAESLWALGPVGLGQLQALDLSGASGMDELTELVASQCSALQRLRVVNGGQGSYSFAAGSRRICGSGGEWSENDWGTAPLAALT